MQVIMSFLMLAMIFMMLPRASVSAKRINEVLEEKIAIQDGTFDGETEEIGTVEFKNVSFKYPDADEYTVEEWLQSNICRCTSYAEIRDAMETVFPNAGVPRNV